MSLVLRVACFSEKLLAILTTVNNVSSSYVIVYNMKMQLYIFPAVVFVKINTLHYLLECV